MVAALRIAHHARAVVGMHGLSVKTSGTINDHSTWNEDDLLWWEKESTGFLVLICFVCAWGAVYWLNRLAIQFAVNHQFISWHFTPKQLSTYANHGVSLVNSMVYTPLAVMTFYSQFSPSPTYGHQILSFDDPWLITGPVLPNMRPLYWCFMGYILADLIWVLGATPDDIAMAGHHAVFFTCTFLFYWLDALPLLCFIHVIQEFSSPFLVGLHVFRDRGLMGETYAKINAAMFAFLFFVFRICGIGAGLAHLYFHLGDVRSAGLLRNGLFYVLLAIIHTGWGLQWVWFMKIVKLAKRAINGDQRPPRAREVDAEEGNATPVLKRDSSTSSISSMEGPPAGVPHSLSCGQLTQETFTGRLEVDVRSVCGPSPVLDTRSSAVLAV